MSRKLFDLVQLCQAPFIIKRYDSIINSGTIFFLDTGTKKFAVTANHVIEGYEKHIAEGSEAVKCQVGNVDKGNIQFEPLFRIIDRQERLDIATLNISDHKVAKLGKFFFKTQGNIQLEPKADDVVIISGFPAKYRDDIGFKFAAIREFVKRLDEEKITCYMNFKRMIDYVGCSVPKAGEAYLGGLSGAPIFVVNKSDKVSLHLGGVFTQGIQDYDIIYAARADFINLDGTIRHVSHH